MALPILLLSTVGLFLAAILGIALRYSIKMRADERASTERISLFPDK